MPELTLNDYQTSAMATAIYPKEKGLEYAVLGLANESGEVAGKLKKHYRDKTDEADRKKSIRAELADVLWYVAAVATENGDTLEDVAREGLAKLASRAERGVLGGSGDNR